MHSGRRTWYGRRAPAGDPPAGPAAARGCHPTGRGGRARLMYGRRWTRGRDRMRGRLRTGRRRWTRGRVGDLLADRHNSLGLIRLAMAVAVIVSHSRVLGFGAREPLVRWSRGQITLGQVAVYGFFVLSGVLVTRSGARLPLGRFLWHRALRLLPGLWVCLLVTAFAAAPALYWQVHGHLGGFTGGDHGPAAYVRANALIAWRRQDVSGVMADATRHGHAYNGSFDGALWSLRYEALCYCAVAVLAATGVLRRARRVVLLLTAVTGWLVVGQAAGHRFWNGAYSSTVLHTFHPPLLGPVGGPWLAHLGFAFALGACVELYRERVPVSDVLGAAACLTVAGSLHYGYFFTVGLPALAYALVWLAVALPAPLRRVGARADYSYGLYIYGFVVEQTLTVLGAPRLGYPAYLALSLAGSGLVAVLSWHGVERPAMALRHLMPGGPGRLMPRPMRRAGARTPCGCGAGTGYPDAGHCPAPSAGPAGGTRGTLQPSCSASPTTMPSGPRT